MKVTLLSHTQNPEKIVAAAASMCYSQKADVESLMDSMTPEKIEKLISHLMESGHESPFEHASFTFAVEGVSRSLLAQLTRSRIASFSVRSQRYCGEQDFETVMPPEIEANDRARITYRTMMADIKKGYKEMQGLGIKNEDARSILPNACCTRLVFTMNTRQLWNWLGERCCSRAQLEIRQLAIEVLRQCKEAAPLLFRNAGPKCMKGYCPEGPNSCGKAPTMSKLMECYQMHQIENTSACQESKQ